MLRESGVLSSSEASIDTSSNLRHLIDETSDLIDSPVFPHILTLLNNEAFSVLIDGKCAVEAFKIPPSHPTAQDPLQTDAQNFSSTATIVPPSAGSSQRVKLATILAVVSRQAHSVGDGSGPQNEYLSAMEQNVRELEAFAAVVYSSNFELHPPGSGPDSNQVTGGEGSTVALTSTSESSPRTISHQVGEGTTPPPGGESSLVDLTESSASIKAADPNFEKVWGQVADKNTGD